MWGIELIDIGGDGCVATCNSSVETLPEAELVAKWEITRHLQTVDVRLRHDGDLIYEVISDERSVGVVKITSL